MPSRVCNSLPPSVFPATYLQSFKTHRYLQLRPNLFFFSQYKTLSRTTETLFLWCATSSCIKNIKKKKKIGGPNSHKKLHFKNFLLKNVSPWTKTYLLKSYFLFIYLFLNTLFLKNPAFPVDCSLSTIKHTSTSLKIHLNSTKINSTKIK